MASYFGVMCRPISPVTSWSLYWLPANLTMMTTHEDVTAPSKNIFFINI